MRNLIGRQLKALRQQKKLTQAVVAQGMGREQTEIARWENGKVRIPAEELPLLAKVLDVPIDAFFAYTEDPTYASAD